jgi:hypothetical protein
MRGDEATEASMFVDRSCDDDYGHSDSADDDDEVANDSVSHDQIACIVVVQYERIFLFFTTTSIHKLIAPEPVSKRADTTRKQQEKKFAHPISRCRVTSFLEICN